VGILTLPLHSNYGGILQAVALSRYLTAHDKEVVLLDRRRGRPLPTRAVVSLLSHMPFQNIGGIRARERGRALHAAFVETFLGAMTAPLRSSEQFAAAIRAHDLDAVVVGSDQVWRLDYVPPDAVRDFFLGFESEPAVRRIAYGASFGVGDWRYPAWTAEAARLLARFDAVSVREDSALALLRDVFARPDGTHVLDPTLLVDPAFYERAAAPPAAAAGPVALRYTLDESGERQALARAAIAALGEGYGVRALSTTDGRTTVDLPHWLRAFMDAEFIVTDSYHGTIFAIVFAKNFIAIPNEKRGSDRFTSLLRQLDLSERLVPASEPDRAAAVARTPIDYAAVHRTLDELRAASARFLLGSLS
jgi:hypothetical protein